MKKTNLFLTSVAVVAALYVGSANAAPNRGGGNHHAPRPFVTHTHGAPRHGGHHATHHNPPPVPMPVQVSPITAIIITMVCGRAIGLLQRQYCYRQ